MSDDETLIAMTWEEWSAELVRLAGDEYGPGGPIVQCGEGCWRPCHDQGDSPEEALEMDRSYRD